MITDTVHALKILCTQWVTDMCSGFLCMICSHHNVWSNWLIALLYNNKMCKRINACYEARLDYWIATLHFNLDTTLTHRHNVLCIRMHFKFFLWLSVCNVWHRFILCVFIIAHWCNYYWSGQTIHYFRIHWQIYFTCHLFNCGIYCMLANVIGCMLFNLCGESYISCMYILVSCVHVNVWLMQLGWLTRKG